MGAARNQQLGHALGAWAVHQDVLDNHLMAGQTIYLHYIPQLVGLCYMLLVAPPDYLQMVGLQISYATDFVAEAVAVAEAAVVAEGSLGWVEMAALNEVHFRAFVAAFPELMVLKAVG